MKANLSAIIVTLALLPITSTNAQTTESMDNDQDATKAVQEQKAKAVDTVIKEELPVENSAEIEQTIEEATNVLAEDSSANAEVEQSAEEAMGVVEEEASVELEIEQESTEALFESSSDEDSILDETLSELSGEEALGSEIGQDSGTFRFERPIPQEGDIYLPVLDDAKVFAEFIDSLPAVVNYYTYATEEEIITFYTENFGEPIEQERKRGRLTVTYYLDNIATRVVISEQDNYRQVDVLQEDASL